MKQPSSLSESVIGHSATLDGYRPDIDGLRAIAVLSVMGFHAFPKEIRGGFIGVDIFFVISGFLISSIIFGQIEKQRFSIADFYVRRIKRIFPSLITVILFCLGLGWVGLLADEYRQLGKHVAAGTAFASNLVLWGESGYFDNAAETKPLLHLWSLAIEEQFYIFWPLLALTLAHWRRRLNALLLGLIVASFALNLYALRVDTASAFYVPLARFWELLAGALLASWALHRRPPASTASHTEHGLSVLGAVLLLAGLAQIDKSRAFPGWWALLPVGSAVALIAAGPQAVFNRHVLSWRPMMWIGLLSYPLYLWHWPLLSFLRIINSKAPDRLLAGGAMVLALALAWLTYRLIETPIRFSPSRRPVVSGLVATMLALGSWGLFINQQGGVPDRAALAHTTFTPAISAQFTGPFWPYMSNANCQDRYPFEEAKSYRWWFCMINRDEPPTLLLLGNSYANQLYPGLTQNPALQHHSVLSIGNCDPARVDPAKANDATTFNPCSGPRALHQQAFIDQVIARTPSLRYVIMDGLLPEPQPEYIARIEARIAFLEQHDLKVIVFTPHLTPDYDIRGCFSRPFKRSDQNCEMPTNARAARASSFQPLVDAVTKSHPRVAFFDPNGLFCEDGRCRMVRDGMPLYRDEYHHISEYGSTVISRLFVNWAQQAVPGALIQPTAQAVQSPPRSSRISKGIQPADTRARSATVRG